ncbi:MAG TPA: VIT domain-containing protein [Thermohalobaculum sp.]|nr:VIT domain-containing protein [Thermohalobaculum sp.]
MRPLQLWSLLLTLTIALASHVSRAELTVEGGLGGHMFGEIDGQQIALPVLKTEVTGDLDGDLATITVRQVFANPTLTPMNARYLFPLNKDAAVHAMQMQVGDELVIATIAKRQEARETFETAKQEGKAAALLEQQRPNMFTQEIANLMPGLPVTITMTYSQVVPRIDGAYELRVPLVVGPRYIPQQTVSIAELVDFHSDELQEEGFLPESDAQQTFGEWLFPTAPAYPEVAGLTIPPLVDQDRVSLKVNLRSGIPINSVASATHGLDVAGGETAKTITLGAGATIDNRDFVLRYSLASAQPQAGLLTHQDEDGTTFSMLIEPPQVAQEGDIAAREMVFILDTSGSMHGNPIEASKTFMRHALKTLRPADSFRIISFSNAANEFSTGAIAATPRNLAAGTAYVDQLQASGGTEFLSGLRAAYARPTPPNLLRIVVFLSDGYVGNEAEILRLIARDVGKGRLYAFGVGTAVNRYLIVEMARLGRGLSRIIDPTTDGNAEAIAFASRLRTPVLTDIRIDWGDLAPQDVTPAFIPDLFDGDSIRVQGRIEGTAGQVVEVHGRVNGRPVSMPLQFAPSEAPVAGGKAIPFIWARSLVADGMRELMVPSELRLSGWSDEEIEKRVTGLGLANSLVTQWTSFIAASQQVVNTEPETAISADVPLPMVKGVTKEAYPPQPGTKAQLQPSFGQPTKAQVPGTMIAFSGGSTPEPAQILGLIMLLLTLGCALIGRNRRHA